MSLHPFAAWFAAHEWTYYLGHPDYAILDSALFAWRVRWFQPENNPFGEA